MGVEFAHWLFVEDLAWEPTVAAALAVYQVLEGAGLVKRPPDVYLLPKEPTPSDFGGYLSRVPQKSRRILSAMKAVAEGTILVFDDPEGGAAITRVFGPSAYRNVEDRERYLVRITVVLGREPHLFDGGESGSATTDLPCTPMPRMIPSGGGIEWSGQVRPPAKLEWSDGEPPSGWDGVWASGIGVDFGKDLPEFVNTDPRAVPDRDFVMALEDAMGARFVEVGYIH